VAQDKYASVIRYERHMLPILRAVSDYTRESTKISNSHPLFTAVAGHP